MTAVINNDMIGNVDGGDGIRDTATVRVFSEGTSPTESDSARRARRATGGEVTASPVREYGKALLTDYQGTLFAGVEGEFVAWMSHGDAVTRLPDGFVACAATTDTPIASPAAEPRPLAGEIDFLLDLAAGQLAQRPTRADILACFTGVRPLVAAGSSRETKSLPRDHMIESSRSGLVTITGGKWTTYRRMAEDAVDRIEAVAGLPHRPCSTRSLRIHGSPPAGTTAAGIAPEPPSPGPLAVYGTVAESIRQLAAADPRLASPIHASLPTIRAQVVWAVRQEMARTVDDVLSRRTRDLVIDARAAIEAAPVVASIIARELGRDEAWQRSQVEAFRAVAETCLP